MECGDEGSESGEGNGSGNDVVSVSGIGGVNATGEETLTWTWSAREIGFLRGLGNGFLRGLESGCQRGLEKQSGHVGLVMGCAHAQAPGMLLVGGLTCCFSLTHTNHKRMC